MVRCLNFQQVKTEYQKLSGLLQDMKDPNWKMETINMDFIVDLPLTQRYSIWVFVDRSTKFSNFIVVKSTYSVEGYAKICIEEIVSLNGIPLSILSD